MGLQDLESKVLIQKYKRSSAAAVVECRTQQRHAQAKQAGMLLDLPWPLRTRHCIGLKDEIYALLGIASDCQKEDFVSRYLKLGNINSDTGTVNSFTGINIRNLAGGA